MNYWLPPTWIFDGAGLVRGVETSAGKSDVEKWDWGSKSWVPASNADFAETLPPRGRRAAAAELAAAGITDGSQKPHVRLLVPPTAILDGAAIVRVLDDPATSDLIVEEWSWKSRTWEPASSTLLAETLPGKGKRLSPAELAAEGIPAD